MRTMLIASLFLGGCASHYTVKVPVLVSTRPSSYEAGCLAAMHRAAATNKSYRKKLKGKVYSPSVRPGSDDGLSCTAALRAIGTVNAEYRKQIEEETGAGAAGSSLAPHEGNPHVF